MCLVLLSVAVVLGVGSRAGRPLFGLPRFAVTAVHNNASLIAMALLAVHIGTLLADPYAQLRLFDLVLPFAGRYRPVWLGLGTLGSDLLLAVLVTSLLRHRLGWRAWRGVHWLAYAAWPVALAHTLGDGTDNGSGWLWGLSASCTVAVVAAVIWRTSTGFGRPTPVGASTMDSAPVAAGQVRPW
jgi:sulfoxide reductase heme-binding subunit YedZ